MCTKVIECREQSLGTKVAQNKAGSVRMSVKTCAASFCFVLCGHDISRLCPLSTLSCFLSDLELFFVPLEFLELEYV